MLLLLMACDQRPPHVDFSPPADCPDFRAWGKKIGVVSTIEGEVGCSSPPVLTFIVPVSRHQLLKGGATFTAAEGCEHVDTQEISLPATGATQAWAWARQCLPQHWQGVELTTAVQWPANSKPTGIGGLHFPVAGVSYPVAGEWTDVPGVPDVRLSMTADPPGDVADRARWVWEFHPRTPQEGEGGTVVLDLGFPEVRVSYIKLRSGP